MQCGLAQIIAFGSINPLTDATSDPRPANRADSVGMWFVDGVRGWPSADQLDDFAAFARRRRVPVLRHPQTQTQTGCVWHGLKDPDHQCYRAGRAFFDPRPFFR
nr:hypothetical protein TetV2_00626 [Oceanusvirus sp.]